MRYSAPEPLTDASCCHCSMCRRTSGSAFGAYGAVSARDFRWTHGADRLTHYRATDRVVKAFCAVCGSLLVTTHTLEPELHFVSLGTLDDGDQVVLLYHQFAASKAPWHTIADAIPRHAAWPPDPPDLSPATAATRRSTTVEPTTDDDPAPGPTQRRKDGRQPS